MRGMDCVAYFRVPNQDKVRRSMESEAEIVAPSCTCTV